MNLTYAVRDEHAGDNCPEMRKPSLCEHFFEIHIQLLCAANSSTPSECYNQCGDKLKQAEFAFLQRKENSP